MLMPEGTPRRPNYNVGQAYARYADQGGAPDFDLAVQRHRMLEAVQRSSDEERRVRLSEIG
jgi:predicted dehydrogenase